MTNIDSAGPEPGGNFLEDLVKESDTHEFAASASGPASAIAICEPRRPSSNSADVCFIALKRSRTG